MKRFRGEGDSFPLRVVDVDESIYHYGHEFLRERACIGSTQRHLLSRSQPSAKKVMLTVFLSSITVDTFSLSSHYVVLQ